MATNYDSTIIQQFADRLYKQADQIVLFYGLFGFLVGGSAGTALGMSSDSPAIPAVIGGLVLCALFVLLGRSRAFVLRLQAQTALCQAQIERNTSVRERS